MLSDSSNSDSNDSGTKTPFVQPVIEYYKHYTQNQKLSEYFCGDPSALIDTATINQASSAVPAVIVQEPEDNPQTRPGSPASSITSNRKLEWDNGADIGYDNCATQKSLHKSFSLPVLPSSNLSQGNLDQDQDKGKSESEVHTIVASSEDNDREEFDAGNLSETDVSSTANKITIIKASYRRIGSPIAKSTPHETDIYVETPVCSERVKKASRKFYYSSSGSSNVRLSTSKDTTPTPPVEDTDSSPVLADQNSSDNKAESEPDSPIEDFKKVVTLCVTKPVIVECIAEKPSSDQIIQTTLVKNQSAAIQTDQTLSEEMSSKSNSKTSLQSIKHDEDKDSHGNSTETNSAGLASKCDSFEYVQPAENADCAPVESEKSMSEEAAPLGELISNKHSNNLIADIERSVTLIQRLANSKRYDDVTKKYYLKKVVQKIINNCYSGDNNMDNAETAASHRNEEEEKYLKGNVPWKPPQVIDKASQLEKNTYPTEIVPEKPKLPTSDSYETNTSSERQNRLKKSRFTLPSTTHDAVYSTTLSSSHSSNRYNKNWKTDKTRSEKYLEENKDNNGDNVISFARKERENQLNWISNEITHLSKLKKLLENEKNNAVNNVLNKPQLESLKPVKRSTAVYMITTERSSGSEGAAQNTHVIQDFCGCCQCAKRGSARSSRAASPNSRASTFQCQSNTLNKFISKCNCCICCPGNNVPTQTFQLQTADGKTKSGICRYVFEIPIVPTNASVCNCKRKCTCGKSSAVRKFGDNGAICKPDCVCKGTQTCDGRCSSDASMQADASRADKRSGTPCAFRAAPDLKEKTSFTSSSSTPSSGSSENYAPRLCPCCRKCLVAGPSETSIGSSTIRGSSNHVLCNTCYTANMRNHPTGVHPYYTYPGHTCNCYTYLKTSVVRDIQKTVKELSDLERREEYCKCGLEPTGKYCPSCKCKVGPGKKKKGIAYVLMFDKGDEKKKKKKRKEPEEIKIEIPVDNAEEVDCSSKRSKGKHKKQKTITLTLQEYLSTNKPKFVQSAEERRRYLMELAYMREKRCQKYKQLLALTGAAPLRNNCRCSPPKRMFTTKEMKQLTAKHYKTLPEVQQKLIDNREKQLKFANRILADIFNKKLRENALKGKVNLSTSVSVINFI